MDRCRQIILLWMVLSLILNTCGFPQKIQRTWADMMHQTNRTNEDSKTYLNVKDKEQNQYIRNSTNNNISITPEQQQLKISEKYKLEKEGWIPIVRNANLDDKKLQKRTLDLLYHVFVEPSLNPHGGERRPSMLEEVIKTIDNHIIEDMKTWSDWLNPSSKQKDPVSAGLTASESQTGDTFIIKDENGQTLTVTVDDIISSLSQLNEKDLQDVLLGTATQPIRRKDSPNITLTNIPYINNHKLGSLQNTAVQQENSEVSNYTVIPGKNTDEFILKKKDGSKKVITINDIMASLLHLDDKTLTELLQVNSSAPQTVKNIVLPQPITPEDTQIITADTTLPQNNQMLSAFLYANYLKSQKNKTNNKRDNANKLLATISKTPERLPIMSPRTDEETSESNFYINKQISSANQNENKSLLDAFLSGFRSTSKQPTERQKESFVELLIKNQNSQETEKLTIALPSPLHYKERQIPSEQTEKRENGFSITSLFGGRSNSDLQNSSEETSKKKVVIQSQTEHILANMKMPDNVKKYLLGQVQETKKSSPFHTISRADAQQAKKKKDNYYYYEQPEIASYVEVPGYGYTYDPSLYRDEIEQQPLIDVSLLADFAGLAKLGDKNKSKHWLLIGDPSKFVNTDHHK